MGESNLTPPFENEQATPLVHAFIEHLRIDKGSSPHTLAAYRRDLVQCSRLIQSELQTATDTQLQEYVAQLRTLAQKPASIARKVSALKQFYRFLLSEGLAQNDPSLFLDTPKPDQRLPKALNSDTTFALLKAVDEGLPYPSSRGQALQKRDRAMVYLLYATGVRVSELITIELSKIDIEAGLVRVTGKRNKERMVPFVPVAGVILSDYLESARAQLMPVSDALFVSERGSSLSRQAFWKILKQLSLQAGLSDSVHPHLLRHTFASDLLHAGMNLRSLQILLGHADLQTTEIYTHIAPAHLKEVVDQYHPRGRGKK